MLKFGHGGFGKARFRFSFGSAKNIKVLPTMGGQFDALSRTAGVRFGLAKNKKLGERRPGLAEPSMKVRPIRVRFGQNEVGSSISDPVLSWIQQICDGITRECSHAPPM
eukprot:GEMP01079323.1.p1 GENE.GEMP01079323.1~~GEMP01079323.1.p1  ORF type:complete len:109 (-),score=7.01 GEMP01079323.1:272-598(-)